MAVQLQMATYRDEFANCKTASSDQTNASFQLDVNRRSKNGAFNDAGNASVP